MSEMKAMYVEYFSVCCNEIHEIANNMQGSNSSSKVSVKINGTHEYGFNKNKMSVS